MTMHDEEEAMDAASKALAKRVGTNQIEVTLTNGIVLRYRPVPPLLVNRVAAEQARKWPKPPVVYIEEKGREETNPLDPAYLQALEWQQLQDQMALEDVMLAAGVEIVSWPDGYSGPSEEDWFKDSRVAAALDYIGPGTLEAVREDPVKRKVVWIKFYALESYEDVRMHTEMSQEIQLVREEAVAEALRSFRGQPPRTPDLGVPAEEPGPPGDRNRADRRRSGRVRAP